MGKWLRSGIVVGLASVGLIKQSFAGGDLIWEGEGNGSFTWRQMSATGDSWSFAPALFSWADKQYDAFYGTRAWFPRLARAGFM